MIFTLFSSFAYYDILKIDLSSLHNCTHPFACTCDYSECYCCCVFMQAIYCEAIAMVEEYQQAISMANLGGVRDVQALYPQLGLKNSPQVCDTIVYYGTK